MIGVYLPYRCKPREEPSPPAHGCPMYVGCRLDTQALTPADTSPIGDAIHLLIFRLYEDVSNVRNADDFEYVEWRLSIDWQDCDFIFNVETLTQLFLTHDRLPWDWVFGDGGANLRPDTAGSDLAIMWSELSPFVAEADFRTSNLDVGCSVANSQRN